MEGRLIGDLFIERDRRTPLNGRELEAMNTFTGGILTVPQTPAPVIGTSPLRAADGDERPKVTIETPAGQVVIHPADYVARQPVYEGIARYHGLPVGAVWGIVHAGRPSVLGAARATGRHLEDGRAEHVVYINALMPCRMRAVQVAFHEFEHVRNADCLRTTENVGAEYTEMEARCQAAAGRAVLSAVAMAQRSAACAIDAARCRTCALESERPCPQGSEVFEAVQSALRPL